MEEAKKAIQQRLSGQGCRVQVRSVLDDTRQQGWPLAYVLAWLSVAGTNSVMPPWVLFNFPQAAKIDQEDYATPRADNPAAGGAGSATTPPGS